MRTLGIIGGIGPESTIEYYRMIFARYREKRPDGSSPSIIVNSIDLKRMLDFVAAAQLEELTGYLRVELERLKSAGSDLALMAANTPHVVFDELAQQVSMPLISIVEATCESARARGLHRVGLIGTTFTMQGQFYQKVFEAAGIAVVIPTAEHQAYVHDRYMRELVMGVIKSETRERLWGIVQQMRRHEAIDGVVLGGTELSLIMKDEDSGGLPLLDTTRLHVEAAVAQLVEAA